MSDRSHPLAALERYPRIRLGHTPTPLEAAPRLGAALGIDLWIKRDDCTGLALGGNKVRQLEFYLGEAKAQKADTILITGAVQSNFVRLAAAGARRLGMKAHLQLEERVANRSDLYRRSGNVLLDRLLGATLHPFLLPDSDASDDAGGGSDLALIEESASIESAADDSLDRLARRLEAEGHRPYTIHLGVGHPPLGGLGYVCAACEIVDESRERGLSFDHLILASGSALTHSGILVGMRALGEPVSISGICVRRKAALQRPRVEARAAEVAKMIDRLDIFSKEDVDVCDAVFAPGYGALNPAVREAIALAARTEALLLDPVYTGKAMAGLIARVRNGDIAPGSRVLFLHTGGLPALFAYADRLVSAHGEGDDDADPLESPNSNPDS
ncbi:D-cysteine desulfhydrase family protein [Thioalkalivibrio sp. HK1]|uniref:D-cysteine desulfhydrase family protein n=1 Tax=Thioalkalivibrio sp. HK1 TaxID=1469245 RepID=UPI000470BF1D|nr:D-cysteine desulfhydrase family protein [Thioalkalivibrio sp. HK1]